MSPDVAAAFEDFVSRPSTDKAALLQNECLRQRPQVQRDNAATVEAFQAHIRRRVQDGEVEVNALKQLVQPVGRVNPHGPAQRWRGASVVLAGLLHDPSANGLQGTLTAYDKATGRFSVELDHPDVDKAGRTRHEVHARPANILCGGVESCRSVNELKEEL